MEQSLEDAQYQKYEELCRKLRLRKTDHVLEIGSGWGGLLSMRQRIMVAGYDCHHFGEQFKYVLQRIAHERLTDKSPPSSRLSCYQRKFDKIVSIEMLEAVGHEYYHSFFNNAINCLKKTGY